jgi:hypothetical protein
MLMEAPVCDCDYGPIEKVATDDEGYCVSFLKSDLDGIERFFQENGFVVVGDAVPVALREELIADLWRAAQFEDGIQPEDLEAVAWEQDVYRSRYKSVPENATPAPVRQNVRAARFRHPYLDEDTGPLYWRGHCGAPSSRAYWRNTSESQRKNAKQTRADLLIEV